MIVLAMAGSGCESTHSRKPVGPSAVKSRSVGSGDYNKIVRLALERWNMVGKESQFAYVLDPDNRQLSSRLRASVAKIFPTPPDVAPENVYVLYLDEVAIPDENFAFVTMRATNSYDAVEFAVVCQKVEQEWTIREYFLVAEGLLHTSLHNFNWEAYRSRLIRNGEIN